MLHDLDDRLANAFFRVTSYLPLAFLARYQLVPFIKIAL